MLSEVSVWLLKCFRISVFCSLIPMCTFYSCLTTNIICIVYKTTYQATFRNIRVETSVLKVALLSYPLLCRLWTSVATGAVPMLSINASTSTSVWPFP